MVIKKIGDFYNINENNDIGDIKLSIDEFLEEIKNTCVKDFKMKPEQGKVFIRQYNKVLQGAWEQGFTPKEAIASTKRYGKLEK